MTNPVLVEVIRGETIENRHRGVIAVARPDGVVQAVGDIDRLIFPRSSYKILQALPLVESGAARAAGLQSRHLALACASHEGAREHTQTVEAWLHGLNLAETDLECGIQEPNDKAEAARLRQSGEKACQLHNNCSGKHAGFLTTAQHLRAGIRGYTDPSHAVQRAAQEAIASLCDCSAPLAFGIDGCSAPNFAVPLRGLALAMARLAAPQIAGLGATRAAAAESLRDAMRDHPFLIAGEGRACTLLAEATGGRAIVKVGADGVYTGIIPERGIGFAMKIEDGSIPAVEVLCAALLRASGLANGPVVDRLANPRIHNRAQREVGQIRAIVPEGMLLG